MSLRNYLFALIGTLILLLAGAQLLLVYWINENLNQEVQTQAKKLSKQVIELVVDEFSKEQQPIPNNSNGISTAKNKQQISKKVIKLPSSKDISELIDSNHEIDELVEIFGEDKSINTDELKIHLNQLVEDVHNTQIITTFADDTEIEISSSSANVIPDNFSKAGDNKNQRWLFFDSSIEQNNTQQLINTIQWMIIFSALIALSLGYWLSVKFNRPLKQLADGFDQVAHGDYQVSIEPKGVKEIRQTLIYFNHMVQKIDELTEQEKHSQYLKNLAELGDVSLGLAHALRNPVHTIGLSIEQLNNDELSKQQKDNLLATVKHKIAHIDQNIKALLTLTSSGLSRNETVPILAVVQDIILEYKSCNNGHIRFDVNIPHSYQLIGAETEIRSILHTLIINACQASEASQIISITALVVNQEQSAEQLNVTITDQGKGLAPEVESHLFQPHVSSKPEGAGMGLYIAKRLINLHYQGDITLINNQVKNKVTGCIAQASFKVKHEK